MKRGSLRSTPTRRVVPATQGRPDPRRPAEKEKRTVNKILLTGRLTRDPELRSLASGKTVTQERVTVILRPWDAPSGISARAR